MTLLFPILSIAGLAACAFLFCRAVRYSFEEERKQKSAQLESDWDAFKEATRAFRFRIETGYRTFYTNDYRVSDGCIAFHSEGVQILDGSAPALAKHKERVTASVYTITEQGEQQ